MTDADAIEDLLDRWEDAREEGRDIPVAGLCRDRPDLADRVAGEIARLRRADWMVDLFDRTVGGRNRAIPGRPGDLIAGRYRLDSVIGEGGFGVVWRADDTKLEKTVAVKLPRPGPRSVVRPTSVCEEYDLSRRLAHPNIVPIYDSGVAEHGYFIVSELVHGGSLADRLREGPVPIPEAVRIIQDVAAAVAFLHGEGVIHRDLKPGNILRDIGGRARITDLGTAILAARGGTVVPLTPAGTWAYMAPEALRPNAPINARSDIYSLGVILYELLTGRRPFAGGTASVLGAKLRGDPPQPPSDANPLVPAAFDWLTRKCLAPDPNDRFARVDELIDALGSPAFRREWLLPPVPGRAALTDAASPPHPADPAVQWTPPPGSAEAVGPPDPVVRAVRYRLAVTALALFPAFVLAAFWLKPTVPLVTPDIPRLAVAAGAAAVFALGFAVVRQERALIPILLVVLTIGAGWFATEPAIRLWLFVNTRLAPVFDPLGKNQPPVPSRR